MVNKDTVSEFDWTIRRQSFHFAQSYYFLHFMLGYTFFFQNMWFSDTVSNYFSQIKFIRRSSFANANKVFPYSIILFMGHENISFLLHVGISRTQIRSEQDVRAGFLLTFEVCRTWLAISIIGISSSRLLWIACGENQNPRNYGFLTRNIPLIPWWLFPAYKVEYIDRAEHFQEIIFIWSHEWKH